METKESYTEEQRQALREKFAIGEKTLNEAGVSLRREPKIINFTHADFLFKEALKYFVGDRAIMLDEYNEIIDWLKNNEGKGLMIMGRCGTGKSLCACQIIPLIFSSQPNPVLLRPVNAVDFSRQRTIDFRQINVIDDLGRERHVKEYGTEKDNFSELIDMIARKGGLAIVTTNLTASELKERYGEMNYDRMRVMFKIVAIEHDSMRV